MKRHKFSFNQLVENNKQEILKDKLELEKIEKQIDKRHGQEESQKKVQV
jgi:Fur-regulated basic protein B